MSEKLDEYIRRYEDVKSFNQGIADIFCNMLNDLSKEPKAEQDSFFAYCHAHVGKQVEMHREALRLHNDGKHDEAFVLFRQAAELGDSDATFWLGECYLNGWGTKKDVKKAAETYQKIVGTVNVTKAQFRLGVCYLEGKGVRKDQTKGLQLVETAAMKDDAEAQLYLAEMYEKGETVPKDPQVTAFWRRLAASVAK